ncbi:MAG TPA: c-type cytochrome [Acidimicrobiales bacterium]
MHSLLAGVTVLAASTVTVVGAVITAIILIGFVVYVIVNVNTGRSEAGSEIELAPNRKPYFDDEELETSKLNRTLRWALISLVIVGVGLPLYWLNEPSRQSGAVEGFQRQFVSRGERTYTEGSQCENCHGPDGTGGQAPYTITDADNKFVAQVNWRAPALNTVLLRYSEDEVTFVINYGRPFSPMPGWGAAVNKGPLNEQQISDVVAYLESIQLSPEDAQRQAQVALAEDLGLLEQGETDEAAIDAALAQIDYQDPETGRALFNLEVAGGAYACARCHTRGWSIIPDSVEPADADLSAYAGFPDGSGALGPNLTGGLVDKQFASVEELALFVSTGSVDGEAYGNNGIGSGKMPGFGDNPNTENVENDGMMTQDMIEAIARYEASLPPAKTTTNAPRPGLSDSSAASGGEG